MRRPRTGPWLLDPGSPDFPPASLAAPDPDGLLALGGDYSVPRLLAAYRGGIFPWSVWRGLVTWHSPDPRFVLPSVMVDAILDIVIDDAKRKK